MEDNELSEEQMTIVERWHYKTFCLVLEEEHKFRAEYPELKLMWELSTAGLDGEKRSIFSCASGEEAYALFFEEEPENHIVEVVETK